jgi:hypothetical protein
MGFNCAINVEGLSREECQPFFDDLERKDIIDGVRSISFGDNETISIVEYHGVEFLGRYGEFPLDEQAGQRLWLLFEFGDSAEQDCICDFEEFRYLSDKLPKLEELRSEIESATGHETHGVIYAREGAYSPWGLDSISVTGRPDPEQYQEDES